MRARPPIRSEASNGPLDRSRFAVYDAFRVRGIRAAPIVAVLLSGIAPAGAGAAGIGAAEPAAGSAAAAEVAEAVLTPAPEQAPEPARQGAASGLNLALGQPGRLQRLEAIFAKRDFNAAGLVPLHAAAHLLAPFNSLR